MSIFLVIVAMSAVASKDRGVYFGGGINLVSVGIDDPFSNSVHFETGEVILGYKYNRYLGIEVRGGTSFNDESIALDDGVGIGDVAKADIDQYSSIYYRAELANEIAKVYFLLGRSTVSTTIEFEDLPDFEASQSGLSYGIGFGLWLDERMNLNFEIKSLVDTESDSFASGGINADYRF